MKYLSNHWKLNIWQLMILSFLGLITFGALLLKLPFVEHQEGLSWIDAFFTSTSAVCVTGLVTVTTSGFNLGGQLVILLLIQLGAIGIMTMTSSFLLAIRGNIGLKHRVVFSQLNEHFYLQDTNSVLQRILTITFLSELLGWILLTLGFWWHGVSFDKAMYQGFFHSISAFCNAGFSTYDESLIGMNALIKYTISGLIIAGGLGYFVIFELIERYKCKRRFSLHSRIVLLTTASLIIVGVLLLALFEQGQMNFADLFFHSVTTRTAGFNSVDLTQMRFASIFLLIVLMFIGASPGSTVGGITTTTFFVIIYSIISVLKGQMDVVVFKRSIPYKFILKSFATAILYFLI
ncbi:MAG TPA: potassium transporter, partial [Saprospiraceae bacterium]|nr:potassium transporter [Saprospiraceae bacterium]